jgi:hypothetical protein
MMVNHCKIPYIILQQFWKNSMPNPITHYLLTPSEAEEKALLVAKIRADSRSPWMNGKKTSLPKPKEKTPKSKKED